MSFQTVAKGIASKQGVSMKRASAILAAGTRRAGASARRKNPKLNRVKGYKKGGRVSARSVQQKQNPAYESRTRGGVTTKIFNGD
jgi:hypothetical protein